MKITKNELKTIVKECLVEILSEGIGPSASRDINEVARKNVPRHQKNITDVMRQTAAKTRVQSHALKEAIKIESGGNDVMAAILADTAERSLPSMLESDRPGAARLPTMGTAENIVASADPEELFGEETAAKWANLAFASPIKK